MLVCALDTKGEEAAYVIGLLEEAGLAVTVVDTGILAPPAYRPRIGAAEVAAAAGESLAALAERHDRGAAVEAMMRGAAVIVRRLHAHEGVSGIIGLGGSSGTSVGTAAMRALPLGVPKVMASTLASGNTRPYVGQSDITMVNAVVDISGLNVISREMLGNAAYALIGMIRGRESRDLERQSWEQRDRENRSWEHRDRDGRGGEVREAEQRDRENRVRDNRGGESGAMRSSDFLSGRDKPLIAASMFGVTTPCVDAARAYLERHGYEVLVFHGTGTGGATMESLIEAGYFAGVLDITTSELADDVAGGLLSAGPDRLTAAGRRGVPQVVSVGAADMANFGPPDTVPEPLRTGRLLYAHNPNVTLMRTNEDENRRLGELIASKLNAGLHPERTAVFLPLRGVSSLDAPGEPFHGPQENEALFQALRQRLRPEIALEERTDHINDEAFALAMARTLLERIESARLAAGTNRHPITEEWK